MSVEKYVNSASHRIVGIPSYANRIRLAIHTFPTIDRVENIIALKDTLKDLSPYEGLITAYALRVIYTDAIEFNWQGDEPQYIKDIEVWWGMVTGGNHVEAFRFFKERIPMPIGDTWDDLIERCQKIWGHSSDRT